MYWNSLQPTRKSLITFFVLHKKSTSVCSKVECESKLGHFLEQMQKWSPQFIMIKRVQKCKRLQNYECCYCCQWKTCGSLLVALMASRRDYIIFFFSQFLWTCAAYLITVHLLLCLVQFGRWRLRKSAPWNESLVFLSIHSKSYRLRWHKANAWLTTTYALYIEPRGNNSNTNNWKLCRHKSANHWFTHMCGQETRMAQSRFI